MRERISKFIPQPRPERGGFTLIDAVVACLLLAMITVASANIVLSTYTHFGAEKIRYVAAQEAARLNEELKNYATADTSVTRGAPGSPPWHMQEDTSCAACWALSEGKHDVTARLPAAVRADRGATLTYTVRVVDNRGREDRGVSIQVKWKEPETP